MDENFEIQTMFNLSNNSIYLDADITLDNISDYTFGGLRLTKKGYDSAARYIDGMLS
jgi:hypothetical protein